ncbi:MAG: hypothetical protein ACLU37_09905 [Collinsella sp.]
MTKDDKRAFEVPDRLFEYVRAVVDNRALATVLLFLLGLLLIGIDNIAGILAVLLIGFVLIDRFEIVRRCVAVGGAAWVMTLAIGAMALGGIGGPVLFDAGFVFNMLGLCLGARRVRPVLFAAALCTTRAMSRVSSIPTACLPPVFRIA